MVDWWDDDEAVRQMTGVSDAPVDLGSILLQIVLLALCMAALLSL